MKKLAAIVFGLGLILRLTTATFADDASVPTKSKSKVNPVKKSTAAKKSTKKGT